MKTLMSVDVFPVVYSTLDCEALTTRVLPHYRIEEVTYCQFWHRGLSDIYLVETTRNRYILRVSHSHWRSQADIEFELELLDFLYQKGISVANPLRSQDGRLAIEIDALEGKRYAALFPYAPGKVALGDLNPEQGFKLGQVVAQVHQASLEFRPRSHRQPLTLDYLLDDSLVAIAPFLQHRPQDLTYIETVIDKIRYQLRHLSQKPPFWVVCWGDPHSGNAHFTAENAVTLFDFDQCGYGWRSFEIGKFLQVALSAGIGRRIRDAFIGGYQSLQPLTEEELNSLQYLTQAAHIWAWSIGLSHERLHNYSRLDDSYFNHRMEQLKMLTSPEWQLF
jgi:Ser/Thr protein kinase RdoA (MazF antagonist)